MIDFDKIHFILLSVCVSIFTQLSVVITMKSTTQFSEKLTRSIHYLSSCTFWSLSSLSGLLLYWNNMFIKNSNKFFSALYYQSFSVKNHSGKNGRGHYKNLPYSETIWRVSFKQPRRYIFTSDTLTQLFFSCIFWTK